MEVMMKSMIPPILVKADSQPVISDSLNRMYREGYSVCDNDVTPCQHFTPSMVC